MTNTLVVTGTAFCNLHIEEDESFPKWQQQETEMKMVRETINSQYVLDTTYMLTRSVVFPENCSLCSTSI